MPEYRGILFVGDPHVASRAPGFRKDDFTETILAKLAWCLDYAHEHHLLCCFLGDTFNYPRDNATRLLGDLCRLLVGRPPLVIYGNHDCRENELGDDDTLSVLIKARLVRLVTETDFWRGDMCGRNVIVGGTSWGNYAPQVFWEGVSKNTLTFWMMHHDVRVPGYETIGSIDPHEIPGIDVVVNGHIHQRLPDVRKGKTLWITPGNIARLKRSSKDHVPAVLRIDVDAKDWSCEYVPVPHEAFEDVFHEEVVLVAQEAEGSAFVRGLAELQARKTATGAGLQEFLDVNLPKYEPPVAQEIMRLAQEVMEHA